MKHFLTFALLSWFTLAQVRSEELPNLRELSILDEHWAVIDDASSEPFRGLLDSRIVFRSMNGELVSLQLQRIERDLNPKLYKGGPWTEATISTFPGGRLTATARMTSVSGSIQLTELRDRTPALAFTTYWCRESDEVLISHGYSMAIGAFRVLLQHTSESVITPEFVQELANSLIKRIGEQDGADQPATAVESKSEGKKENLKADSEDRPR